MRDDFLVVLDWEAHVVRAGVGVGEVIAQPSITIPARVAVRAERDAAVAAAGSASAVQRRAADYLVGQALDEAERSGEELEIVWPLARLDRNEQHAAAQQQQADASIKGKEREKLVEGVQDWTALEALFRHILTIALKLPARPVNHLVLLSHPATLPLSAHEQLAQLFFEQLGVSNLLLVERPLTQLYSCAAMSGIVVDVLPRSTDVTPIHETAVLHQGVCRCDIGEKDCDDYLARFLVQTNPALPSQLSQPALQGEALHNALLRIVEIIKAGEYIKYVGRDQTAADRIGAPVEEQEEEGITDVAKALASGKVNKMLGLSGADAGVEVIEDGDRLRIPNPISPGMAAIEVGPERHRYADPLFDPSLLGGNFASVASLPETIASAVRSVPAAEKRLAVWESIVVTGGIARIQGVAKAVVASVQRYAVDTPQLGEGGQLAYLRRARHAKTPDYFSEYRERQDVTSFLGGCIYAKLGFTESQGGEWMTKQAYNDNGPSIARTLTA